MCGALIAGSGSVVFHCPVPSQPCPNSSYPIYLPQVSHSSPAPQPYLEYPPCPISLPRGIPPSYLPLLRELSPLPPALVLSIFILPQTWGYNPTPTPVPHSPVWVVNPLPQSPVWGITLPQSPVPHLQPYLGSPPAPQPCQGSPCPQPHSKMCTGGGCVCVHLYHQNVLVHLCLCVSICMCESESLCVSVSLSVCVCVCLSESMYP